MPLKPKKVKPAFPTWNEPTIKKKKTNITSKKNLKKQQYKNERVDGVYRYDNEAPSKNLTPAQKKRYPDNGAMRDVDHGIGEGEMAPKGTWIANRKRDDVFKKKMQKIDIDKRKAAAAKKRKGN